MRDGCNNGNWKGGVCSLQHVDEFRKLPKPVQRAVIEKIELNTKKTKTCWKWLGSHFQSNNRASISFGKGRRLVTRLLYALTVGPVNDLCVLHTCDNNWCVNPNHLFLGTQQNNSTDMVNKGRQAKGDKNGAIKYPERLARGDKNFIHNNPQVVQAENNGMALLTNEQVLEIRKKYKPYVNNHDPSNQRQLAAEYGVATYVIALIGKRKTWRSI